MVSEAKRPHRRWTLAARQASLGLLRFFADVLERNRCFLAPPLLLTEPTRVIERDKFTGLAHVYYFRTTAFLKRYLLPHYFLYGLVLGVCDLYLCP